MILLTGATGHVGGRLLRELERDAVPVRCLARSPEKLTDTAPTTEVAAGDVRDADAVAAALADVDAAYYLVHALSAGGGFEQEEADGAAAFAHAARAAGVGRLVYLSGIARGADLSDHMRSRHEVGRILRESGVPTLELRASIVVGDGSLSFELVRRLVDVAPAHVLPSWVDTPCQPIALADVVAYLRAALDVPLERSEVVEVGGADRTTYRGLIEAYAAVRSRPTAALTLPAPPVLPGAERLLPEGLRAPLKLVESMRHDSSVAGDRARELFPAVDPAGLDEAIRSALAAGPPVSGRGSRRSGSP